MFQGGIHLLWNDYCTIFISNYSLKPPLERKGLNKIVSIVTCFHKTSKTIDSMVKMKLLTKKECYVETHLKENVFFYIPFAPHKKF